MISFEGLCNGVIEQIEEILQRERISLSFNFVVDTGEYQPPKRDGNEVVDYINGVFTLTSSDIASLPNNSTVATQTGRLDLVVRLPDLSADEVYNNSLLENVEERIRAVRNVIKLLASKNRTYEAGNDSVSTIFQDASSGERAIYPNVGDGFSFSIIIYWIIVEGGINTRSFTFAFDSVLMPYQAVTLNNSKTFDSNVYADTATGRVENTPIQANWSATFELPAIKGLFWEQVLNCLTGNDKLNTVHCLSFKTATSNKSYLVNIGEVTLNGETVKNAGLKVSFFEARYNYHFVSLPNEYKYYRITSDTNKLLFGPVRGFYMLQKNMQPHYLEYSINEEDLIIEYDQATNIGTIGDIVITTGAIYEEVGASNISEGFELLYNDDGETEEPTTE